MHGSGDTSAGTLTSVPGFAQEVVDRGELNAPLLTPPARLPPPVPTMGELRCTRVPWYEYR